MRNSLRNRLNVTFIGLAIGPLILVGLVLAYRSFTVQREQALTLQHQVAERVASEVDTFIQDRENELRIILELRRLQTLASEERTRLVSGLLSYENVYEEVALLDARGQEEIRASRLEIVTEEDLIDRSGSPEFEVPMQTGEAYHSPIGFDDATGEPVMTISMPVLDLRTGAVEGVLVGTFRFKTVWDLLADAEASTNQTVYMVDAQDRVVAHSNPSVVLGNTRFDVPEEDGIDIGLSGSRVVLAVARRQFGDQVFAIVAEQPASDALVLATNTAVVTAVVIALALAIAASARFVLVRRIVQPVELLASVARDISQGDLNVRADIPSGDEVGELASSFNIMTERLSDSIRNLETRVAERTRDLRIASDVSRQATTVLKINDLLPQLVELTREGFDLDLVSIYLYDASTDSLKLSASTGEVGRRMIASSRTLQVNDQVGLVAQAARERKSVVVNDVLQSGQHLRNPFHISTQSEIALPMAVGHHLVGVLDLQSNERNRFTEEDREILTTLGEQTAIAIRNAHLFEEAREARIAAEQANETKSRFLANMSHELRTPLNAVLNFTSFVMEGMLGPITKEQADALDQSFSSAKHLLSLINDVLDLSKIETGMMDLFIQEVDIKEILASTIGVAKGLVRETPIELVEEIEEDIPHTYGDKRRLRQVVLNLISNAVKFTQEGNVTVGARCENGSIHLSVTDTGIGIAPEDRHLVFESFKQVKHGLSMVGGTGLGMPITKYFVESHRGEIWFESKAGIGTTFHVRLPVLTEEEALAMNQEMRPEPVVS